VLLAISRPVTSRSADPLLATVDAVLRARGAQRVDLPAPPTGRVTGALSPREGEVSALVAEGLSNRDIAARLFVSERTAENHVQNILNKLGFSNRAQIAAWVARADR
jgi:DNA-binding NarL/FixJ family response regulator